MKKNQNKIFSHDKIDIGYSDLASETTTSGRAYTLPNGSSYPSVTTVLSILTEDSIRAWKNRVGEEQAEIVSGKASRRGTKVHSIIEKYLNNEDTSEFLPHIQQSLENLKPILNNDIGTIFGLEVALYSDHLGVAGRCDCVAQYNGVPSIIDFKTSRYIKKKEKISNYFAQGAAYAIMWEERTNTPITQLVTIIAVDNEQPQVFIGHRDKWTDLLFKAKSIYESRM